MLNRLVWIGFILLFFSLKGNSQTRYVDSLFSEINKHTFTYSDTLQLDFYSPDEKKSINRPLLILVHGGGFAGGKRDNPLESKFCKKMAAKGYVVASISYRLTRKGKGFGCNCPASEKMKTFVTVSEDILKATSFLINKKNELFIDSEKIILIGSSAGAEGVLNTVFMQNHKSFKYLPYNNIKFASVVSFAGAVLDINYINKVNALPLALFHGKKDKLVPYETAPHHYCKNDKPGYLMLNGSGAIVNKYKQIGASYKLFVDSTGNHNWANLAYSFTGEIAEFIYETVVLENKVQCETPVSPNQILE
ncbi:carboxylesterase family protein [Abyssalbus ytuae]|uniref:Alpha/beta hydrolase n=1 Tax=Abyssalbus ytuae TaxID=2926907 RepID=A0A9E6ZK59_9FLAO|nr:carboxylesterase family protein [Abyssalbus ytuae]UOB17144.1 alpha/beta hydrolase [Abyssalbus ytuae]